MQLHFTSKGVVISVGPATSTMLPRLVQWICSGWNFFSVEWFYTHSEWWNLLAWTNLLKKMKRCCFLKRTLTKIHHWCGQASVSVCIERPPLPPHYEMMRKRFQSHPKKGIFCISANQNKVCSVFLWPVMEIFSSRRSLPFNSNRSLSWQTEGWVAITVVVTFKCKGQIVKIKIVNRSIFLSLTVLCHST